MSAGMERASITAKAKSSCCSIMKVGTYSGLCPTMSITAPSVGGVVGVAPCAWLMSESGSVPASSTVPSESRSSSVSVRSWSCGTSRRGGDTGLLVRRHVAPAGVRSICQGLCSSCGISSRSAQAVCKWCSSA